MVLEKLRRDLLGQEVDGSIIVDVYIDHTVRLADGRLMYWKDESFRVEPQTPLVASGEWVELTI